MKKAIFLLFTIIIVFIVGGLVFGPPEQNSGAIKIGENVVAIEIADDTISRQNGLKNRESLAENSGMLFIFDKPGYPNFWMKDVKFPLDFIWIRDNTVVDITKNAPPATDAKKAPFYRPKEPIRYILEVNGGYSDAHGVKIGDRVDIIE